MLLILNKAIIFVNWRAGLIRGICCHWPYSRNWGRREPSSTNPAPQARNLSLSQDPTSCPHACSEQSSELMTTKLEFATSDVNLSRNGDPNYIFYDRNHINICQYLKINEFNLKIKEIEQSLPAIEFRTLCPIRLFRIYPQVIHVLFIWFCPFSWLEAGLTFRICGICMLMWMNPLCLL